MSYHAPVADIAFTLRHVAGLDRLAEEGAFPDLTPDLVGQILEEAGKFAGERIAPLNQIGDRCGAQLVDGAVRMPPGWREVYRAWCDAGWNAVSAPVDCGGQGLPHLVNAACIEMWNAASMAFGLGPLLTMSAVEAIAAHGSDQLKRIYLGKLVSGEWMGTMNITEAQAGSDLGALRTRAERQPDGSYRLHGTKVFITYGEHDLTDNIIHLVLARLPDAPEGTRGLSLFLVPKVLVADDGTLGARNDVVCTGIEKKLGIHASPTCTMQFGDREGAVGYLVGEENRGLTCMFTMMNHARLAVGLQGVAIADRAFQQALSYARDRRQGRAPGWSGEGMSPIVEHPDVKRMLLEMRAKTEAARALCYAVAGALDRAAFAPAAAARASADDVASLLTPVAKAFSTDIGVEVASLGVQVHGGAGYVEETGAAQHLRDARIAAIYEGTNGIQAVDLVSRKLPARGGQVARGHISELRGILQQARSANDSGLGGTAVWIGQSVDALERTTHWMLDAVETRPADALAGATPYLRLFALATGGAYLAKKALAAMAELRAGSTDPHHGLRVASARFFAAHLATAAAGLEAAITEGAEAIGTAFGDAA
ncbi:acyl-CoA dehydrogenase family protein [Blastochloris tepida]|uniref:3-methylmercaptopropionyl-CoA dehydrogenase n=1 Tax=Blastochloris tepida TaxID=2233851 RepID=A0A348FVL5_9HYPH|nr:acyl-CoA dehydrogenase family protein [Blastochloris tepida]BBF91348.1 acyl-CoA dehydrogenase [Blastochloris tepida]